MTKNVVEHFETLVVDAVAALVADGAFAALPDSARFSLDVTKDPAHGDYASNAAMVLAKPLGLPPRKIAEAIASRLATHADVEKVEVAGPGFVNLTAAPAVWPRVLTAVLVEGDDFGRAPRGAGPKVNVEYVSANPTGPLHVGHCRGAVVGDALANLLAFAGHDVTREYYINDAGNQVDVLARSAFLRYREALGEAIGEIPEGMYPGEYLKAVGAALVAEHGPALLAKADDEAAWLPTVRAKAITLMLAAIKDDLKLLGIEQDVFFSERSLVNGAVDEVAATIAELRTKGLIYEGRLPPPKGKVPEDWEDREQTLFRATAFGDDMDRALIKSDGSYTYFASDMAYHRDKVRRGFRVLIDVWGADHAGHIKKMVSAVRALSDGAAELDVKVCQLVKLFKSGQPYTMSKRAGTFVTLRDIVEEVGRDAVRFMMLYRKNDASLDFDFDKVTEQSKYNPVFYVQYGYARTQSVLRQAREALPTLDQQELARADFTRLTDEAELQLIKRIAQFPRLVEQAARAHEPHRVAFYLYDLASDLHGLWNRGKDLPHLRFIHTDNVELTTARLGMVKATAIVIHRGLSILGVRAPDEMR